MKEKKAGNRKMPEPISERRVNATSFPARRIPSNVLKRTLEIVSNQKDGFWLNKNTSCIRTINRDLYRDIRPSATSEKLHLARNCLMQRDYKNLAKLLASNLVGDTTMQKDSYTVFAEYAELLKKFTKLKTIKSKTTDKTMETHTPEETEESWNQNSS